MIAEGHKRCTKCREVKPLAAFHRRTSAADGRQSWCMACTSAAVRRGRAESPERRERVRLYNTTRSRACAELVRRHRSEFDAILAALLDEAGWSR